MKKVFFILLFLLSGTVFAETMPKLILWAWEAPQNLSSIDPNKIGVATLAATMTLDANRVSIYTRHQPLITPKNTYKIAVIHIQARSHIMNPALANIIAQHINRIYHSASYQALQIDFEPNLSQRHFYKTVLIQLRQTLPHIPISITALASWCTNNRWIGKANLPIDYVVPMYFSLSSNSLVKQNFIAHFPKDLKQLASECRSAVGLATFEPWQFPLRGNIPVFVFTRKSWQPDTINQAIKLAHQIQSEAS